MIKKLFLLAILICMIFPMAFAAGEQEALEAGVTELEVACFEGGYGRDYWVAIKDEFEKAYPDVKVNLVISPQIFAMMRPRVAAGNPPDIMPGGLTEKTGLVLSMMKEKNYVELNDVFEGKALDSDMKLKDRIIPGCLENNQVSPHGDGKIAFIPMSLSPMGLVYNSNYFETNNIPLPVTWDDFFALGDQLKAEGRSLFTYQGIYAGYNESFILPAIASSAGIDALQKVFDYAEGAWTDPKVKRVLQMFADIGTKGYLMKGTTALNHTQSQADMMMGKAAFIPNGNWMENEMKDAPREEGFEFGVMAPPTFDAADDRYAYTGFQFIFIPKKAKNVEMAKEFIRFMYTEKSAMLMAEKASQVIPLVGTLEKTKDLLPKSVYNFSKVYDTGAIALISNWKALPAGTKINYQKDIYDNSMTDVMNGQLTVDQWVANLEATTKQLREDAAAEE